MIFKIHGKPLGSLIKAKIIYIGIPKIESIIALGKIAIILFLFLFLHCPPLDEDRSRDTLTAKLHFHINVTGTDTISPSFRNVVIRDIVQTFKPEARAHQSRGQLRNASFDYRGTDFRQSRWVFYAVGFAVDFVVDKVSITAAEKLTRKATLIRPEEGESRTKAVLAEREVFVSRFKYLWIRIPVLRNQAGWNVIFVLVFFHDFVHVASGFNSSHAGVGESRVIHEAFDTNQSVWFNVEKK